MRTDTCMKGKNMRSKAFKSLLATALIFCVPPTFAADTNIIPSLTINGQTHTNVQFGTVTASYATILYDGGGERVALSNLPPDIQRQLNYDPAKAKAAQVVEAQRKAAANERAKQLATAWAAAAQPSGPPQTIQILKLITESHLYVSMANGRPADIFIHNLPYSVISFMRDFNSTQASVAADKNNVYNDRAGGRSGAAFTRQAEQAATRQHLMDLNARARVMTRVIAAPTSIVIGGNLRQWEFQGMAYADNIP